MKTISFQRRCIALFTILTAPVMAPHAVAEVAIPDPSLASAIRYELVIWPTDPITESTLAAMTYLSAKGYDIVDLTGLEYCTSLEYLRLEENQISDLTPLAGLTGLKWLLLGSNPISDLTPLAGLTSLKWLQLGFSPISDLTPLAGLTSLTSLGIAQNLLTDLTPLQGLTKLTALYLYSNRISDLTPLAGLTSLTDLELMRNQITDLTPLSGLTSLTDLDLRLNCISDLFPLLGLNALVDLFLEYNPLSDTTIAEHIPQLSDNFAYVTYYPRSDEYCPASEGEGEGETHPADMNTDWRMVMSEAVAYLAGWQQGSNPMNYAIRAAYLWQNGEQYAYDAGQVPSMCWILAP